MEWKDLLNCTRIRDLDQKTERKKKLDEAGRTEFDRDYDRLVFSTPFKRLQDKAQVFPLEEHDGVRTRLTHSLEVASVARGLTHSVALELPALSKDDKRAMETIAAACALAHDLGNPPFGHAGERAIVEWFRSKKASHNNKESLFKSFAGWCDEPDGEKTQLALDFLNFDGNSHTQRLLSRLQVLSDQHGMNLTVATLAASCKYTVGSHEAFGSGKDARGKKHGYFASENNLMQKVFDKVGTNGFRHPLAHLVEAADDIVNRAADLEDGVRKRRINIAFLKKTFKTYIAQDQKLEQNLAKVEHELKQSNAGEWALAEGWASVFRTWAIAKMTTATRDVFLRNYKRIMKGTFKHDLIGQSSAKDLYALCKLVVEENIFTDRTVIKRELMGKRIIHDLMDFYWPSISCAGGQASLVHFNKKAFELISPNYRHVFHTNAAQAAQGGHPSKGQIPLDYYRMQLLTDQISGMTDSYAVDIHRELFNA